MKRVFIFIFIAVFLSCASNEENEILILQEDQVDDTTEDDTTDNDDRNHGTFKVLSLGDSYTIGASVCNECRFPNQLTDSLSKRTAGKSTFPLKIIAQTGWTTTNLINAIATENLSSDYNLVTLLIGVNNQYQKRDFSIYESEFPQLVNTAIKAAKNDKEKLIVVSIPDYAYTPFGNGNPTISQEIDTYNAFAKNYCEQFGITFINITDITRIGLINPAFVANDGLHPSELAYTKFVERILPIALKKLNLEE